MSDGTAPQPNTPMDREAFVDFIEGHLLAAEDVTIRAREPFGFLLRVGESEIRLNLDSLYDAYRQRPDQTDAVARTLLRALHSYNAARGLTRYEEIRERVFPMLKPIALLADVRERNLPMLAYRPFLADLIITYVIDEPTSLAYINEGHLERWQLSEQQLHDEAISNLAARTAERGTYTATGEGAQRIVVFNTQDGFDATRLLLPAVLAEWRPHFAGQMVIGVPNRDFLVAFSDADRSILASVARQIQLDAAQREHGLTDQLFTLTNGEIREYIWE